LAAVRTRAVIDLLRAGRTGPDALARAASVADLRELARRELPRPAFDFADGAAEDERTARANEAAFAARAIVPRVLRAPGVPRLGTRLLGAEVSLPLLLAPAGLAGVMHPAGEPAVARAAAAAGTHFIWPCMSSRPLQAGTMFQLYAMQRRADTDRLVDLAASAGCEVLVLTADTPAPGLRERDLRNGFGVAPRPTPASVRDALAHPRRFGRWLRAAPEPGRALGNFGGDAARWLPQLFDAKLGWDELERLRARWPGRLALKGVLHPDDAVRAADCGAVGVIVSNHGGRQLDGVPASLDVLPAVVAALDGRVQVLLDGGVRRGSDIVRALALGADGVCIGRPWCWALAAGGEAGVARLLEILRSDLERTLILAGLPAVGAVTRATLQPTDCLVESRHVR
jgi:isopentenyl diphosphate isomerase/L-lactate dehydrogenase-like FMN-dependent dehydrogenase